jgi:hypothetical protein
LFINYYITVVKITFVEKDAQLALKIKEVIGGGTIVHPKNSNYLDLLFQDVNSIQKIAVLQYYSKIEQKL